MVKDRSFYDVLELDVDADEVLIKKAYKKLALRWHPDKNASPEAQSKFQEISEAYSVLVDGEKRKHYDKYGREDADEDFDMEEFMATVFGGSDFTTFLSMMGMFAAAGELDPLAGMQEEDPELVLEEAIDLFLTLHTEKTGKSGLVTERKCLKCHTVLKTPEQWFDHIVHKHWRALQGCDDTGYLAVARSYDEYQMVCLMDNEEDSFDVNMDDMDMMDEMMKMLAMGMMGGDAPPMPMPGSRSSSKSSKSSSRPGKTSSHKDKEPTPFTSHTDPDTAQGAKKKGIKIRKKFRR